MAAQISFVGSGLREVDRSGQRRRHPALGTRMDMPVSLPFSSGMTLPTALAAPVEDGDDVAGSSAASLASPSWTKAVNGLLGGGGGVNGGHEAVGDAELVVQDLGDGGQAVSGAGSVGDERSCPGVVLVEVDAADEHRGIVLAGSGEDNDLGAGVQVRLGGFLGQELTGALEDVINAQLAPGELASGRGNRGASRSCRLRRGCRRRPRQCR